MTAAAAAVVAWIDLCACVRLLLWQRAILGWVLLDDYVDYLIVFDLALHMARTGGGWAARTPISIAPAGFCETTSASACHSLSRTSRIGSARMSGARSLPA